ncbi:hypothetical protein SAMN05216476_2961 [Pseudomonas mediterranea]|uniref:Uncharacterized protein n=1 Tax=Pseudomonas mediterranea TaxID=183795 RepID=A0AAX2DCN3_9PSED|nr:hypothetical protein SAMN05216476_2961 [Pseudomonas mediterranea]
MKNAARPGRDERRFSFPIPQPPHSPCESELARDGYLLVASVLAGPPLSRAGSLPHGFRDWPQDHHPPPVPCGSELARDGYLSVASVLAGPPLSRAGSLPQGFRGWPQNLHPSPIPCGSEPARDGGGSVVDDGGLQHRLPCFWAYMAASASASKLSIDSWCCGPYSTCPTLKRMS